MSNVCSFCHDVYSKGGSIFFVEDDQSFEFNYCPNCAVRMCTHMFSCLHTNHSKEALLFVLSFIETSNRIKKAQKEIEF